MKLKMLFEVVSDEQEVRLIGDGFDVATAFKTTIECVLSDAAAPAADAVPVVHARWIRDDLMNTRCSNCHIRLPFRHCYDEGNGYEWNDEIDNTPWCMHCGARMDSESEEEG